MATPAPRDINGYRLPDAALLIAMGCFDGVSGVNKFGTNTSIAQTYEDIWIQGGLFVPLAAATTIEVASSSANDTAAGSGARHVIIEGLDAAGREIAEEVILAGQTPVLTTEVFSFVNRMYIHTVGTTGWNEGIIYAADDAVAWAGGVPQTVSLIAGTIAAEAGQTQQAIYKVPSNKTAFLSSGYITADSSKIITYKMFILNDSRRIGFEGTVSSGSFQKLFHPYFLIPSGHMITVRAIVDVTSAQVSAGFDIVLVDNAKVTQSAGVRI